MSTTRQDREVGDLDPGACLDPEELQQNVTQILGLQMSELDEKPQIHNINLHSDVPTSKRSNSNSGATTSTSWQFPVNGEPLNVFNI